jgi:copper chaperone NosL
MKLLPRIVMLLAIAGLLTLFVFPMWKIILYAPQYPDGVTMLIWINKIGGETASTIQNINILNHYVGMKFIEPDSIPELKYFPTVVWIMAGIGLVLVFLNKAWGYLAWGSVMVILAALAVYDFYLWEYDYGHSLSPKAPIKIPGASFQPPLIGTKRILNFIAQSFPHTAGYFSGIGIALSFVAFWLKRNIKKT